MTALKHRTQQARTSALSIAGLDPGGGAGILADMRGFHAAGAYGTAVATMLTVQSTSGLRAVFPATPAQVAAQLKDLLHAQHVAALKTGALGSRGVVRAVVAAIALQRERHPTLQVVVDPVMLPTRGGRRLLDVAALLVLRNELLPLADVVTANVAEAEQLTGVRITRVTDAREAARRMLALGVRVAVVKGGHLGGARSIDVVAFQDRGPMDLTSPRLRLPVAGVHGTGCTFSALLCGRLATGQTLEDALVWTKKCMYHALERAHWVGGDQLVLEP